MSNFHVYSIIKLFLTQWRKKQAKPKVFRLYLASKFALRAQAWKTLQCYWNGGAKFEKILLFHLLSKIDVVNKCLILKKIT